MAAGGAAPAPETAATSPAPASSTTVASRPIMPILIAVPPVTLTNSVNPDGARPACNAAGTARQPRDYGARR
ncbi:hypothetical protein Lfu02_63020 [Longispora fulva]|nr:hypothetical protein Lfu02_63020 [Longispora fulva]